jgi:N-methylhydantoinase B
MRAGIAALPDGTVVVEDWLDNDGIGDRPLRAALSLAGAGERPPLDFSGTAPACRGPVNIARATTVAAAYVGLKHIFPDAPANAGVLEPVVFVIPETSLLAVRAPKPVGGDTESILHRTWAPPGGSRYAPRSRVPRPG